MHRVPKNLKSIDISVILGISIFLFLVLPFIKVLPYLDGETEFIQDYELYTEGFQRFFHTVKSTHPLGKFFFTNISFHLLGITSISYTLPGIIMGIFAIIFFFLLTKNLFNLWIARFSVILFSFNPIWIAESLFSMHDFLTVTFLLMSLYFFSKKAYFLYAVCTSILVLIKEPQLLLPVCVICIEFVSTLIYYKREKKFPKVDSLLLCFIPLGIFLGWFIFLQSFHVDIWHDWLFTPTANKGTLYTIIYNLLTLHLLNKYGLEQWKHVFILNFHWVYWIIILIGIGVTSFQKKKINLLEKIFSHEQLTKTFLVLLLFCVTYSYLALTVQTYAITRYILPIVPVMIIGTAWAAYSITKTNRFLGIIISSIIGCVAIVSLFSSQDPLSLLIWGKRDILQQQFYNTNNIWGGPDAIEYNLQFLLLAKKRSDIILKHNSIFYGFSNCYWLRVDSHDVLHVMLRENMFYIPKICQVRN